MFANKLLLLELASKKKSQVAKLIKVKRINGKLYFASDRKKSVELVCTKAVVNFY